jgi:hypothetical protein
MPIRAHFSKSGQLDYLASPSVRVIRRAILRDAYRRLCDDERKTLDIGLSRRRWQCA